MALVESHVLRQPSRKILRVVALGSEVEAVVLLVAGAIPAEAGPLRTLLGLYRITHGAEETQRLVDSEVGLTLLRVTRIVAEIPQVFPLLLGTLYAGIAPAKRTLVLGKVVKSPPPVNAGMLCYVPRV